MGVESPKHSKLATKWHKSDSVYGYFMADGKYVPNPKHEKNGWGSKNPIYDKDEGQSIINNGVEKGKQIYGITERGDMVKYQPDNTPEKGYHPYSIYKNRDIPTDVLKEWLKQGKITYAEYNKIRKGKLRKVKVPKNEKGFLSTY